MLPGSETFRKIFFWTRFVPPPVSLVVLSWNDGTDGQGPGPSLPFLSSEPQRVTVMVVAYRHGGGGGAGNGGKVKGSHRRRLWRNNIKCISFYTSNIHMDITNSSVKKDL